MFKIHLKAYNGQYMCAENGGGCEVVANRSRAAEWETFTIHDENGGKLESGDMIYLASCSGKFMCAEGGGGREVVANRENPSIWEKFCIQKANGSGEIRNGDSVYLRCFNGQFVCAENGGGREVVANRDRAAQWETFVIEIIGGGCVLPIRVTKYTKVLTAGHMETTAVLNADGKIYGQTTTWSTWKLRGFTGTVLLLVADESGNVLFRSNKHTFGVDGTWVPGKQSRRTDLWEEQMDASTAQKASSVTILQFHDPKNRFWDALNEAVEKGKTVAEIAKVIAVI